MNQPLTIEHRASGRALIGRAIFLIITVVAYFTLIAIELGYGTEQLKMISTIVVFMFAALIVNAAVGLLDMVRYADIHRAECVR